jgi:hypothetical protein
LRGRDVRARDLRPTATRKRQCAPGGEWFHRQETGTRVRDPSRVHTEDKREAGAPQTKRSPEVLLTR